MFFHPVPETRKEKKNSETEEEEEEETATAIWCAHTQARVTSITLPSNRSPTKLLKERAKKPMIVRHKSLFSHLSMRWEADGFQKRFAFHSTRFAVLGVRTGGAHTRKRNKGRNTHTHTTKRFRFITFYFSLFLLRSGSTLFLPLISGGLHSADVTRRKTEGNKYLGNGPPRLELQRKQKISDQKPRCGCYLALRGYDIRVTAIPQDVESHRKQNQKKISQCQGKENKKEKQNLKGNCGVNKSSAKGKQGINK